MVDGRVLLLLDAFDEMATRVSYPETIRNFREICNVLDGKAKAILTCRTHFFKNSEEIHEIHEGTELYAISRRNSYLIADVRSFKPEEIETYVKSVCGSKWKDAYQQIQQTYNLMELAKTPILLEMITQVLPDLIESGEPINSLALYTQYAKNWLRRDDWRVQLTSVLRREFTVAFADSMFTREATHLAWLDVQAAIRRKFPKVPSDQLSQYENDIQICSFIKRDGDKFKFVHESFMEYFVATQLYDDIVRNDNERLCTRRYSAEVLSFLSQHMATQEVRSNLRSWLSSTRNETLVANTMALLATWDKHLSGSFTKTQICNHQVVDSNALNCEFDHIFVKNVQWHNVEWKSISSIKSRWEQCNWNNSVICEWSLSGDDLTDCTVNHSKIEKSKFVDCVLDKTKIANCEVRKVSFEKCGLDGCSIDGVSVDAAFYQSDIRNCRLVGVTGRIEGSNIADSTLTMIKPDSLIGTKMRDCTIVDSSWMIAAFENATFENVRFENFTIAGESNLQNLKRVWKAAPSFVNTRGLPRAIKNILAKCGATFEAKQSGIKTQ